MYILGCDIGASSVKTVVLNNKNEIVNSMYDLHNGEVNKTFNKHIKQILAKYSSSIRFAGVSGSLAKDFNSTYKFNNINSLITGVKLIHTNCNSIIEVGGESACYISNVHSKPKFSLNCSCAAGTGAFFEDQLTRLNVKLEDIKKLIKLSTTTPLIAGRCSVFAKTDIIHRQQEGCNVENIINGLCFSMVKNYKASIIRGNKIESPVIFTGGVSKNYGVCNAFKNVLNDKEVIVDELGPYYQAIGTALLAKRDEIQFEVESFKINRSIKIKPNLPQLILHDTDYIDHKTVSYDKYKYHYLGIDIGSTSTNLVLINEDREVVSIQYLRTEGKPLEVVNAGIKVLYERYDELEISAIGTTGSGRIYIGKKIGANFIKDEITAQAKGVCEYAKDVDTVFEIGGQDSKFIRINNQGVEDFQMNKVCAAGTGSFVEEQAKRLNISLKEYGPLALSAKNPLFLGDRCTVFIQSSVEQSLSAGERIDNIASGVCFSIVHNYLHKVVGNRELGENIYLTGGVCFNYGIVAAFKHYFPSLTVAPYFSVTGAIGIALIALEENNKPSNKLNLLTNKNEIKKNKELLRQTEKDFIGSYTGKIDKNKKTVGIPRALMNYKLFPMAYGFFTALGFNVLLSPVTNEDIIKRSQILAIEETCYPVKLILGHMDYLIEQNVDSIFLPSVYTMKHDNSSLEHNYGCVFMQGASQIIGKLLDLEGKNIKLLNPILEIHMGKPQFANAMIEIGQSLGFNKLQCSLALANGGKNLLSVTDKAEKIGKKLLSNIKRDEKVLVIVTRTYGIDDVVLSMGIKEKLLSYGYKVITLAHLKAHNEMLDDSYPNLYWPFAQHIIGGIKHIKENPNLYAVYLTNHGCGPDTIISHYVSEIMGNKPYLSIEVDEHYSSVGLITRIEAFLSSINNNNKLYSKENVLPDIKNNYFTNMNSYISKRSKKSTLNIPNIYPYSTIYSNLLNSKGINSKVMEESTAESLFKGKAEIRSKEYVSFYSLVGDLIHSNPKSCDDFLIFQNKGTEADGQLARVSRTVLDRKGFSNNRIVTMNIEDQENNTDLLFSAIYGDLILSINKVDRVKFLSKIPSKKNIELLIDYLNKQGSADIKFYLYGEIYCLFNRYLSNRYIDKIEKNGAVGYMSLTENYLFNLMENKRNIDSFVEFVNYFNSLIKIKSPLFNNIDAKIYLDNLKTDADKSFKKLSTINGRFRIAKSIQKNIPAIQFSPMYENLSILMEMVDNEDFINISIDGSDGEMEKVETYLEFK
jgi:predicted CoA-substrate-specific enzyme activase